MKDIHDCECEVITLHGCYRIQYGVQLMRQNISYNLLNSFKRFWEVWGNILRGVVGDHNIKSMKLNWNSQKGGDGFKQKQDFE